jgi:hypothetical protein
MERQHPAGKIPLLSSSSQILSKGEGIFMYRTLIVRTAIFIASTQGNLDLFPRWRFWSQGWRRGLRKVKAPTLSLSISNSRGKWSWADKKNKDPIPVPPSSSDRCLPEFREAANQYQANYFLSMFDDQREHCKIGRVHLSGWKQNAS